MAVGHADVRTTQGYTEKLSDEEMQRKFIFFVHQTREHTEQVEKAKGAAARESPIRASRNR